jgi:hypothetical protein
VPRPERHETIAYTNAYIYISFEVMGGSEDDHSASIYVL